ncbi:MAG: hypothetical protein HDS97_06400 [Bacteroidales bacterium]|nr:hypothetical protein [Bacteroidales bacterium]
MGRGSKLRFQLKLRWAGWLAWMAFWPALIYEYDLDLGSLIFVVILWIVGGFFGFVLWGPGKVLGRVWGLQFARENRVNKEKRAYYSQYGNGAIYDSVDSDDDDLEDDDDDYFDKYYDRHMRWIEAMKDECTYEGNGPGGEDTYSSPFLWRDIPLNDLEIFAGSRSFNYEVSQYIDWDDFREYFPGLETWEYDEDDDED